MRMIRLTTSSIWGQALIYVNPAHVMAVEFCGDEVGPPIKTRVQLSSKRCVFVCETAEEVVQLMSEAAK